MDYLDTRDLQERIDELENEIEELEEELEKSVEDEDTEENELCTKRIEEWHEENDEELKELNDLKDEVPEWSYGNTLVPDEEWIDYVQELLTDCDILPKDIPWYIEIDWEKTADNIAADYGTVDYQGKTYYYRNC